MRRLWLTWFLAIVLFIVLGLFLQARAASIQANAGEAVITIMEEPCRLKHVVDLHYRATWTERGKTFEGCASPHPAGLVVLYFREDKSIALMPMQVFKPLSSM